MTTLSFQTELRPELSANVYGTKDYREFRYPIDRIQYFCLICANIC